jgi:hypothetical protein
MYRSDAEELDDSESPVVVSRSLDGRGTYVSRRRTWGIVDERFIGGGGPAEPGGSGSVWARVYRLDAGEREAYGSELSLLRIRIG